MLYDDLPPEPVGAIEDDRLRLIFICCHPALAMESRMALTLRMVGGLTAAEIARAFLVPEATLGQRITRAKSKIKAARREWYRYHHLFADVLRARLLSEQPAQVPLLHQRASEWYERQDLIEEAITHALAAGDFDRAARLMERAVSEIRRHRQEATMFGWLKVLRETVRVSPVLAMFDASMLLASGDLSGVEPWLDDADRALALVPEGAALPWAETKDLRTLPSTIAMYRAAVAQARGDTTSTAEHARRALSLAGPEDHLARGMRPDFLASPRGPTVTCPARWRHSARRWPACTPPAASSTG